MTEKSTTMPANDREDGDVTVTLTLWVGPTACPLEAVRIFIENVKTGGDGFAYEVTFSATDETVTVNPLRGAPE